MYSAVLDDGSSTRDLDFSESGIFASLSAGTYTLCITATDGMVNFQETCFDIQITEPEPLSVFALQESNVVSLTLGGASLYNVELNGLVTQTENTGIQLDLKEGLNTLKVFTNLPCQGTYSATFVVGSIGILYPNPVGEETRLFLNEQTGDVNIKVFSTTGSLVMEDDEKVDGNELVLDFSGLATGTYYLRVEGEGYKEVFKMAKR